MPGKKEELYSAVIAEKWAPFLAALEKQMKEGGTKFIAGEKVTIADCVMFSTIVCNFCNEKTDG